MVGVTACPAPARADGILETVNGYVETTYNLFSSKTTDASRRTTKTESNNYGATFNLGVNYDLLPKLNLNAGVTYDKNIFDVSGDVAGGETEVTRLRPFFWLTLRDPVMRASIGYDLRDETVKTSGQPESTLTRETYAAYLNWRPTELPSTQLRYTRTMTRDDPRASVDTKEDYVFLKTEYLYRGLNAYYAGTYLRTDDDIRDVVSTQLSHEGKLVYATTFLDGRISLTTDNRVRMTELENVTQVPLPPFAGLSALDDTPLDGALAANPALTDGDKTTSAGLNIGYPGSAGDFSRRNVGLDFLTPVEVSRLEVWVDGFGPANLPADITSSFSWDVYTSTDNLTWTVHATVPVAVFGPFDRRFEISFPAVTARYVKVVTRPLSGGVIGSTNSSLFPNIFITEIQAFVDRTAPELKKKSTQVVQNYNLDVKVILFRSPSLYYRFNGSYFQFDSGGQGGQSGQSRYNISNGLFFNHQLNPIFSASANTSFEVGTEQEETRTAAFYYASLGATPLKTLTNNLVFSGNRQWLGATSTTSDTVGLYNTAQLYRGIDASLNLGASFTSNDEGGGNPSRRRDLFLNLGTGITPHPTLTLTGYYSGKLSRSSGGSAGGSRDTTENRADLGLSFTPFRTLSLSAAANIASETGKDTTVRHTYGLSWAPFPDGNLQFSFYYAQSHLPENSRIIQPTLRWYLSSRRRSYLEASYQVNTTKSDSLRTESNTFSATLKTYF